MTVRTRTRPGRAAVAIGAAALLLASTAPTASAHDHRLRVYTSGALTDLQPAADGPFDGAYAAAALRSSRRSTGAIFLVGGVQQSAWGKAYGVHLHEGPCVKGDGAAAGPHYNVSDADPPVVNRRTEMWLDTRIIPGIGLGISATRVPFVPTKGERSIVIHEKPTHQDGTAGKRLACLPVRIG